MKLMIEKNIHTTRLKIYELDLEPLKVKLQSLVDGPGWTLSKCDSVELLYKNFLFLCFKYPASKLVPTSDIDEFWHAHILDTRKYVKDCQETFGDYLHHFPYLGLRGVDDEKALSKAANDTALVYKAEFGVDYYLSGGATMCKGCRSCGNDEIGTGNFREDRPYPVRDLVEARN